MAEQGLNYRDAGVDIDAGERLIERIKPAVAATARPGVLSGLGGFGGLFELPAGYRQPVLVSGTDGVGTKLKLAIELGRHDSVGIDLVAMCVNDIVVCGAEPLFFLDYYATGKLDVDVAASVVAGIAEGCRQAGCALIGGETAEMPGMYQTGDYDLAGFCVGVVEKDAIITAERVQVGDALVALAASGPHSNGYSLIRKVLEVSNTDPALAFDGATLATRLLAPTRIYTKSALGLIGELRRARPGAHHRWRHHREPAAGVAAGRQGARRSEQLDLAAGVSVAAGDRSHRRGRDAADLQLRRWHDLMSASTSSRRRLRTAGRCGRTGLGGGPHRGGFRPGDGGVCGPA